MKRTWLVALLIVLGAVSAPAQEETASLDELMGSAEQWANENLDEDTLAVLQSLDRQKVKELFADVQKRFHGDYVIDLAALKDNAKALLPLLENYEETLPYAIWLKARLDYLEVADQFRLTIPPPKSEPGKPPKPVPNPTAQKEEAIWITKLAERPWPKEARTYVPMLKPVFRTYKVPPELVWVAEVESSFDPRARSPVGAAGLFQLMPATARSYGLKTGWLWDERLKPEPSARAAAKYLSHLKSQFNDWQLALAAYNAGEGTVQGLLKRYKGKTYADIATHLPAETQMYVPKVEATLLRREGVKLSQLGV